MLTGGLFFALDLGPGINDRSPPMEEAAPPVPPKQINGSNGRKNGHGAAPPVPPKKVETRGRKKLPADRIRPVKYNLHVVLSKDEHEIFQRLAGEASPSAFVRQLIHGAAILRGIVETPPRGAQRPVRRPGATSGVSCTGIVS